MTLKIIHHREKKENKEAIKENIQIDVRRNLLKMFAFCEKIINLSSLILDKINTESLLLNAICEQNEDKNINSIADEIESLLKIFYIVVGKKVSLLDAVSKATLIMSKICKMADDFGVPLDNEEDTNKNEEVLTDEDIDVMVQLVKDFGEEQIREDARECRENMAKKLEDQNNEPQYMDVYDVYHDTEDNNDIKDVDCFCNTDENDDIETNNNTSNTS